MIAGLVVVLVRPGTVLPVVVDDGTSGDATTGIVGAIKVPRELVVGSTLIVGTDAAELTPRLPISVDPSGTPVRAAPPGVVGAVDERVEEAMLLEPEPHIPDMPEVSSMPEVVNVPDDVADIPGDVDMLDVVAVAGAMVPSATPPPS